MSVSPFYIIVIGASLGGMEALKKLFAQLPSNLNAALLVVWHVPPESPNLLPNILQRVTSLKVVSARDKEVIQPGHAYIARPDYHLVIESQETESARPELMMCSTRGPKENRFRPSIDVLFRSAAVAGGCRVIGVVLTGLLDDGAAGLYAVKESGGQAVVQDPMEAACPNMPINAMRAVEVDACVGIDEMSQVLLQLTSQPVEKERGMEDRLESKGWKTEVYIALEKSGLESGVLELGVPSRYTCPECHGILVQIEEGHSIRFRCHTGHAFSLESLLVDITKSTEEMLGNSLRAIQEKELLFAHMAEHYRNIEQVDVAESCLDQVIATRRLADVIRHAVLESGENRSWKKSGVED